MRFIIEARVVDDESSDEPILLGEIERPDLELDPATMGLTLAEGRCLLRDAQQALQLVAGFVTRQIGLEAALVKHEDGVREDHVEAAVSEPTAEHAIDTAVVDFGAAVFVLGNGQFLPRTTKVQGMQDVVEYGVQRELPSGSAPPLGQEGADKFVELLNAQTRRNSASLLALCHLRGQSGRILT